MITFLWIVYPEFYQKKVCKTTNATKTTWDDGETISIPDRYKGCVFPFEFLGKSYSACTLDFACQGCYWCGTVENVSDQSGWGMCNEICPKEKRTWYENFVCISIQIHTFGN